MDWQNVKDVFLELLEVPAENRLATLDARCPRDDQTRSAVLELLAAHDGADEFMREPAGGAERSVDRSALAQADLTHAGPFVLGALLGQGAFGRVYRAEQHSPVRRFAAVKVLTEEGFGTGFAQRFAAESQSLASLDHPSIARFYQAGIITMGAGGQTRPWLAMELVDGTDLIRHAQNNGLSLRQRAGLMLAVVHAVGHAHSRGILHRDLKPSNILVQNADGKALPKIIDFGIAKAFGAEDVEVDAEPRNDGGSKRSEDSITAAASNTAMGPIAFGTPRYMSPEQAHGRPLDVRTDIYSLGCVFAELIAGITPLQHAYATGGANLENHSLAQVIDLASVPSVGGYNAKLIATSSDRRLASALESIIARAIAKDVQGRYANAEALAVDIEHALDGLVISAQNPDIAQRARSLWRNHRPAMTVAAILLASTAGLSFGLYRASRQARIADQQAARLNVVQDFFFNDLLAELTRASQNAQSPTIEQLLDAAASKADDANVDSLVREQLYQTLLDSYAQLHAYEKSVQMGLKLTELIEQRVGAQSPELIGPLRMIVASMTNGGQHHEMLGLLKRAVMLANQHLPATDSTRFNLQVDASLYAAYGLSVDGDTSRSAIDRLEELVGFGKRTPEIDRAHVVRAMEFLSDRYIQALEPARAYEVIVQAVQIAQATSTMPRERLLRALLGQGAAASNLNRTQEAVDVINQVIAKLDANVREDRQLLGIALSYRASAQLSEHDATLNQQALSDGKQAKAIKAEFPGMASSVNIVDDRTIAYAMAKLGQRDEALEMLDATIASAKARHMSGLADRSVGLDRASILFAMGKTNEAEQAFAQLLRNAGDSSWLRFNIFRVMASTFDQRDDYRQKAVEAAKTSIEELALARKGSTSWHPRLEDMRRIIDKHAAEK